MALMYNKNLSLVLNKSKTINLFAVLLQKTNLQNVLPVAHYSETQAPNSTIKRAMKSYLEKVTKYDNFVKEQLAEFNKSKEFLGAMMGKKSPMTQADVDEAIEYLFPSALFVPKSRPVMKPPEEIFMKEKLAEFDKSGRPFHFLFYTSKPKFYQCLHDAISKMDELNSLLLRKQTPPKPLLLLGGRWISKEELQEKLLEKLYDSEYEKLVEVLQKLVQHPFSSVAENIIKQFWCSEVFSSGVDIPIPEVTEDGIQVVTVNGCRKKTASANVKVFHPGSGKIQINNLGLDYFSNMQCREQVSLNSC